YQGGDVTYIDDPTLFKKAQYIYEVKSQTKGYVASINALTLGEIALALKAGRQTKEDVIDYEAGIVLHIAQGSYVQPNQVLMSLHTNVKEGNLLIEKALQSIEIVIDKPTPNQMIIDIIK
ncbi:MAG: pyrimidine-nucleoside phosphorylase, partial [Bacilli bacterium]